MFAAGSQRNRGCPGSGCGALAGGVVVAMAAYLRTAPRVFSGMRISLLFAVRYSV